MEYATLVKNYQDLLVFFKKERQLLEKLLNYHRNKLPRSKGYFEILNELQDQADQHGIVIHSTIQYGDIQFRNARYTFKVNGHLLPLLLTTDVDLDNLPSPTNFSLMLIARDKLKEQLKYFESLCQPYTGMELS